MKDLKSQLAAQFGVAMPEEDPAATPVEDPLGPKAHLDSAWIEVLREIAPTLSGVDVVAEPSFANARQLSGRAIKLLKKKGRLPDKKRLEREMTRYLQKRERVAWSRLKAQFTARTWSEKAYRSLKQSGVDPERVLARIDRLHPEETHGLGANRLRELLSH